MIGRGFLGAGQRMGWFAALFWPLMKEGQVFYADYAKPEGFCDEAWKAIYQYVFALANGAEGWYSNDWIAPKHKGVVICSCNDGLRPVIIKVERVNE